MREKDVARLVKSWREILRQVSEQKLSTDIGNLCLEVVGQYVEWIDINLVSRAILVIFGTRFRRKVICRKRALKFSGVRTVSRGSVDIIEPHIKM